MGWKDRAVKVEESSSWRDRSEVIEPFEEEPKTLAEQSVSGLRKGLKYLPGIQPDPSEVAKNLEFDGIVPRSPQSAFYQLMPELERDVSTFRGARGSALKSLLPESPITRTAIENISDPFMPLPSEIGISSGLGLSPLRLPIRRPSLIEKGIEKNLRSLGKEGLPQEQIGKQVSDIYKTRLPLPELTKEQ